MLQSVAGNRRREGRQGPGRLGGRDPHGIAASRRNFHHYALSRFATEVTFLHGLSHVGPTGEPYGRTGALNLCHKFGGATLHVRSRQNTKTNAPQGYGGSGAPQEAAKWPGRPPPWTWGPAQPMSNRSSGCLPRLEIRPPTAVPQMKPTEGGKARTG